MKELQLVGGPLWTFDQIRARVLKEVVDRTMAEFAHAPLDLTVGEALFLERARLRRDRANIFTRRRRKGDRALLGQLQAGLLKPAAEVDRKQLLEAMISHYVEEIGGHFEPGVYRFATHAIPLVFNWLLNAASVKQFNPWKMTESVVSQLKIRGEVEHLKRLADRGTILLVPTHQSNIDSVLIGFIIYLMGLPPFAYGAGLNLFSNPLLSYFMSHLGAYTVDRKKSNQIYKTTLKNYSTVILREGVHSIFFPGGGRSRSGAIESRLKLGLLGTALEAQIEATRAGKERPSVFVVPMTTSYDFVLEASSLIEDYLAAEGRHRFILTDDESWQPTKIIGFFYKLFRSQTAITVRIGKPLDVFGNFVDDEGRSIGPNGTTIDPKRWLTTRGELRVEPQRDHEYTRELGQRLVDRFHHENTVLASHLVAYALFEELRRKYPDLDLYRFLRLSLAQRSIPETEFREAVMREHARLRRLAARGALYLDSLLETDDPAWVDYGVKQLGLLHEAAVAKIEGGAVWTEDMNLLYYYRNRLAGYSGPAGRRSPGYIDAKGFLA